ncbi:hypothetical protein [Duganella sp.]
MSDPKQAPVLSAKRSARDIINRTRQRATRLLQSYLLAKRPPRPQAEE